MSAVLRAAPYSLTNTKWKPGARSAREWFKDSNEPTDWLQLLPQVIDYVKKCETMFFFQSDLKFASALESRAYLKLPFAYFVKLSK